jgi:Delta7-sterol 5-desaturase
MDVVLEAFDLLMGDRLYAAALPVSLNTSPSFSSFIEETNNTLGLFGDAQSYVYKPATSYAHIEPSKYAYMSAWPRDNVYRQCFSLFVITWYDCRMLVIKRFFG